jgi:subtilisin family serine protease
MHRSSRLREEAVMKKSHQVVKGAVLLVLLSFFSFAPAVSSQSAGQKTPALQLPTGAIPGRYIVTFRSDVADTVGLASSLSMQRGYALRHTYSHAIKGFSARMTARAAQALASHPDVASIEPDVYVHTLEQTLPTGVNRIDADLNDIANIDGVDDRVDVDVAIIDTGIDLDHPELNVVFDQNFCSFFLCPFVSTGNDDHGHGSHVAGIVAALDNDSGVVGIAPGARLWALKALNFLGMGSLSDIIKAIDFVTENADQIEVVNMSLGAQATSDALRTAIQASVVAGVVYVVAAGNSSEDVYGGDGVFGTSDDFVPAAYPEVLAVSAMGDTDGEAGGRGSDTSRNTPDDTFADFTNFSQSVIADNPVESPGAAIDVAAPGVDIYSTWKDGGFDTASGTSMASPHVAGAVALEVAENGRADDAAGVAAIRQALIDKAQAQSDWGPASTNDPDSNPEGLVNVASGDLNRPPTVSITTPDDGSTFDSGVPILFEGVGTDDEDGDLTGSLVWESSLDGRIGTGGSFSQILSDGTHQITATVADSGGKTGADSIEITVGTAPPPNTLMVSVTTDKRSYSSFQIARITVAITDGRDPVEGACSSFLPSLGRGPIRLRLRLKRRVSSAEAVPRLSKCNSSLAEAGKRMEPEKMLLWLGTPTSNHRCPGRPPVAASLPRRAASGRWRNVEFDLTWSSRGGFCNGPL